MKSLSLIIAFLICFPLVYVAQGDINGGPINTRTETGIIDGVYVSSHIPTKRLIPYVNVREADVIWSKRVWRTIDLREKINLPLYFPHDEITNAGVWIRNTTRWSLWTVIRHHVLTGDLVVYDTENPAAIGRIFDGDQFKHPVRPEAGKDYFTDSIFRAEVFRMLGELAPIEVDEFGNMITLKGADGYDSVIERNGQIETVYPPRDTTWITSKDIIQYRIKEDWFFDKQRSVLDVRILGLAPVVYKKDRNNNITGTRELFWLYFPTDCRYVFNNYFVYNEKNGAQWMSFDDYFWKRRFSSFIHKEENVYDRDIDKYRVGVDALMESRRITEDIRLFEHDVWDF
jgi:gliding motility associated protien GldN